MDLYIEFLTSLLSAQMHHLHSALTILTKVLWVLPASSSVPGCPSDGAARTLENVHKAIKAVLVLIPTSTSVLMPLVSKGYPFKGKSVEIQVSLCSWVKRRSEDFTYFSLSFSGVGSKKCALHHHLLSNTER